MSPTEMNPGRPVSKSNRGISSLIASAKQDLPGTHVDLEERGLPHFAVLVAETLRILLFMFMIFAFREDFDY
jgi:hypothetical protein